MRCTSNVNGRGKGPTEKFAPGDKHPCSTTVYVHLLQRYERHHKLRNGWHAGGMHGGLGITQDYRQHGAAYEHSIECIRLPNVPIRLNTNYAVHVQSENM